MRIVMAVAGAVLLHTAAVAGQDISLSVQQQNDLIKKRCAVCHSGSAPGGGLLLEGYDAGAPDPVVARMMLIKITRDGAIFAAGNPPPDEPTRAALVKALSDAADAAPAGGWTVDLASDPKGAHHIVTASITQGVYELTMTCSGKTQQGHATIVPNPVKPVTLADVLGSGMFPVDRLSPIVRRQLSSCVP